MDHSAAKGATVGRTEKSSPSPSAVEIPGRVENRRGKGIATVGSAGKAGVGSEFVDFTVTSRASMRSDAVEVAGFVEDQSAVGVLGAVVPNPVDGRSGLGRAFAARPRVTPASVKVAVRMRKVLPRVRDDDRACERAPCDGQADQCCLSSVEE